jgi:spermidine synthase
VDSVRRLSLFGAFAVTGFAALALQVVWQRLISLHAGVDLAASTTVVAAFLAGLGLGNLGGGRLADRLEPAAAARAFAFATLGVGAFAWISPWILYDAYARWAVALDTNLEMFAAHFALLLLPTALMGLSLPLLARATVAAAEVAPRVVGRLYAVNTWGAAAGAIASGWWFLGYFGFVVTARIAAVLDVVAALAVLAAARAQAATRGGPVTAATPSASPHPEAELRRARSTWRWNAVYALTGAVAIGLEVVYFRVVDAVWRNNSYTFATVLAIYLVLFALGAQVAAPRAAASQSPRRVFLVLQCGIGATSICGLLLLLHPPRALGFADFVSRYYSTAGFLDGRYALADPESIARFAYAHLLAPLLVMGAPVALMGASFPFAQAAIAGGLHGLARRTGALVASNIAGNVAGALLTGFLLLDALGTSGTVLVLAGGLTVAGLAAILRAAAGGWTSRLAAGLAAWLTLSALILATFPDNRRFWAFFHAAPLARFQVDEDRSCVSALVDVADETFLYINGAGQNGIPYDSFHVLIGLLPTLAREQPSRALAVGLGIGSTALSLSADRRLEAVDCVELCGGQRRLVERLRDRGSEPSRRLLGDPRVLLHTADGRRWLLARGDRYDVIAVDVVRPNTAASGNLYSVEFYRRVADRLTAEGVFAQWIPTHRVLNSVRQVFPHVVTTAVPEYHGSSMLLASRQPLVLDGAQLAARFERHVDAGSFDRRQREALRRFFAEASFVRVTRPRPRHVAEADLNRDLFPRDEYFLND